MIIEEYIRVIFYEINPKSLVMVEVFDCANILEKYLLKNKNANDDKEDKKDKNKDQNEKINQEKEIDEDSHQELSTKWTRGHPIQNVTENFSKELTT